MWKFVPLNLVHPFHLPSPSASGTASLLSACVLWFLIFGFSFAHMSEIRLTAHCLVCSDFIGRLGIRDGSPPMLFLSCLSVYFWNQLVETYK